MKNFLFLLVAMGSVCACTTPEEDAQIKLFWLEQIMQFMPQPTRPMPLPPPSFDPVPVEEEPALVEKPQADVSGETAPTGPEKPAEQPVVATVSKKPTGPHNNSSQFIEITMEDTRVNKYKSNAPLKERQAMQRALERVKQSNQQALQDIGMMFDGDTQAQAFAIVSKSEKILIRTANTSNTYQNYLNAQRKILQEQDQQLNQLMRANAYKLRRIRS